MNHDIVTKVNHDQTILFIVHVDYVIVFEDFRDKNDVLRSPRSPRRRRQGQSRPNDVNRILRARSRDLRGISSLDGVFRSPRRIWRHLRGLSSPDDNFHIPRGLRRVFRGFFLPNDIIRIPRELSHCFRGGSSPDDVLRSRYVYCISASSAFITLKARRAVRMQLNADVEFSFLATRHVVEWRSTAGTVPPNVYLGT